MRQPERREGYAQEVRHRPSSDTPCAAMLAVERVTIFAGHAGPGARALVALAHLDDIRIVGMKLGDPIEAIRREIEPASAAELELLICVHNPLGDIFRMMGSQHDGILIEQADTFVVYVFFGVDVDLIAHCLKPID